jgi:hypothetical protein
VIDAGAVAPLLRTFAAGIPELSPHLADADGEQALPAAVSDEQRHLHGWGTTTPNATPNSPFQWGMQCAGLVIDSWPVDDLSLSWSASGLASDQLSYISQPLAELLTMAVVLFQVLLRAGARAAGERCGSCSAGGADTEQQCGLCCGGGRTWGRGMSRPPVSVERHGCCWLRTVQTQPQL